MAFRRSFVRLALLVAVLLSVMTALPAITAPARAQTTPDQGEPAADVPDDDEDAPDPGDDGEAPPAEPGDDDEADEADDWDDSGLTPLPTVTTTTVAGKVAMLRTDGKAAIPRGAPKRVRMLIKQANRIVGKPYKLGGGHRKLKDRGYDCSGAVSFALIKSKLLKATMVSGRFKRWGKAGEGRWISVYARKSHVYLEVAGLRLDTSSVGDGGKRSGVRWRPVIGKRSGFTARHPVAL